ISVKVTATDSAGATADSTFTLTVANTNDAPTVANPLGNQSATEDSAFSLDVTSFFTDVDDSDSLTYNATLADNSALPAWLTFDASTATFEGTPANEDVGTISVKVTATDSAGATADAAFDLAVANVNDAPTTTGIGSQTATEDSAFTLDVTGYFADVDAGDTLTYNATLADGTPMPAWLTFDATAGTFSGTAANEDVGDISVLVTATDGAGATADSTFTLTVANTNDAPTTTGIGNQSATEDSAFSFAIPANTFADVDAGDTLTYSATLSDGTAIPAWLTFDASTGTFNGTPANEDVGDISVKVTATDSAGATADSTFTLTVANTNDAPTTTGIGNQTATEDSAFSLDVTGNFADVDAGDSLTYNATLADNSALPAWLTFDTATGTFEGTPANEDVGDISVKVTATDSAGATADSTFTLTVANTNDAPTTTGIGNQSATEDSAFSFAIPAGTFADVDAGDSLTYNATLADNSALPAWLTFDTATGTFEGTPANEDVGDISVKVTATDSAGATADSTFTLTVANTNDAPTVANPLGNQSATEDSAFSLDVTSFFTDVDDSDSLTYNATLADNSALPAWLTFDASTATFEGTPANEDVGTISVKVTATDSAGATADATFDLAVSNVNDAPTT
ncbi:putative Ig domain-containing protein, partial [Kamptonema formosum]|uniref:putative Ig domain-containing protein n=1 Tax=Kamptonema formosum TaxID=331992 RepID=UPI0005C77691